MDEVPANVEAECFVPIVWRSSLAHAVGLIVRLRDVCDRCRVVRRLQVPHPRVQEMLRSPALGQQD